MGLTNHTHAKMLYGGRIGAHLLFFAQCQHSHLRTGCYLKATLVSSDQGFSNWAGTLLTLGAKTSRVYEAVSPHITVINRWITNCETIGIIYMHNHMSTDPNKSSVFTVGHKVQCSFPMADFPFSQCRTIPGHVLPFYVFISLKNLSRDIRFPCD